MDDHEREVRQLRIEARQLLAEAEQAESELAIAQSSIADHFSDWAALGTRLRVEMVDGVRIGSVVHVGTEAITLCDDDGKRSVLAVDHLEGAGPVEAGAQVSPTASQWTRGHPQTMIAHLRSLVGEGCLVSIDRSSSDPVRGCVVGAGHHHVVVSGTAGAHILVPLAVIVSVSETS